MCARYTLRANAGTLMDLFWLSMLPDMEAEYNIAPSRMVLTVTGTPPDCVAMWRKWGLVPSFSREPGKGPSMINARSETAHERPSFRSLLKRKRCLIPADGFFEWQEIGKAKQPYLFEVDGGNVFAFAGLYDTWSGPNQETLETCTILTCGPNELIEPIHDRMPVIIDHPNYADWLNPEVPAQPFLVPFDASRMRQQAVNPKMGNPRIQGPEVMEPPVPTSLFDFDDEV